MAEKRTTRDNESRAKTPARRKPWAPPSKLAMPDAPEKAKTYVGNEWKKYELPRNGWVFAQRNWSGFMERIFKDEIQAIAPEDRSPGSTENYRARTMTPYYVGGVDGKPVVRKEYDDEMIEQNKRIVFVAQNVANVFPKPAGTFRKAFMKAVKALSKMLN